MSKCWHCNQIPGHWPDHETAFDTRFIFPPTPITGSNHRPKVDATALPYAVSGSFAVSPPPPYSLYSRSPSCSCTSSSALYSQTSTSVDTQLHNRQNPHNGRLSAHQNLSERSSTNRHILYPNSMYQSTPPPLPPRQRVIIGRHVARFDLDSSKWSRNGRKVYSKNNSNLLHKKFINPMIYTRRHCTDVLCCFVFTLFIIGWAAIAGWAIMWGKPERLIHPTDSNGRMCGAEKIGYYNLSSTPYLLYFDLTQCVSYSVLMGGCQTPQVCVSQCPNETFTYLQLQTISSGAEFRNAVIKNVICKEDVKKESIENFAMLKSYVDQNLCAAYTVPSVAVIGRCLPRAVLNLGKAIEDVQNGRSALNDLITKLGDGDGKVPDDLQVVNSSGILNKVIANRSIVEKVVSDIYISWWQILAMLCTSALVAFLWTIVMRLLGPFLIWTTIFFISTILATGSAFCLYRYKSLLDVGAVNDFSFQPDISVYFNMPNTWLGLGITTSTLLAILLVALCFVYTRIKLAAALITESSKAIGAMMCSLLFPLFPFVLHFLTFIVSAIIAIYLASTGRENCRKILNPYDTLANGTECDCTILGTGQDPDCQYVNLTKESALPYLQGYNLFGFFWLSCFVSGFADVTLAGAFASFYWAFNKPRDIPSFPIIRSFGRALRYHLGTIAFGSLLLGAVKFVRTVLEYLDRKLSTSKNEIAKLIFMTLKCFFWCFEVFIKFLTRNAFIMTAIYGKNFITSAKESFLLIMKNVVRYAVLSNVTGFLLFLGKATISLGMGVLAYYWFTGRVVIEGIPHVDLYYCFVPIIIVVIGSYFIADSFFSVYEMAVDTTFLCFLEDVECNDGTPDKPYYMSSSLQRIMDVQNQFKTHSTS